MAAAPIGDTTVRLRDGRALAYCEWGHATGPVVLAFHGSPGSRLWWPGQEVTNAAGVHLVTVDRPGYGGSDPLPGRPIGGWAYDVAELAEALGADRFGVVGWSGGAPYAAAVAAALPNRLTGVCLVSSASLTYILDSIELDEDDRHNLELIESLGVAEATLRYAEGERAWADGLFHDPTSLIDPDEMASGDQWLFDDAGLAAGFFESVREGVRQGAIGAATDWVNLVAPWGFSLQDIQPTVHLWHGRQDTGVDLPDFERVATGLRDGRLTVWPDVGHFGPAKHWGSILDAALG